MVRPGSNVSIRSEDSGHTGGRIVLLSALPVTLLVFGALTGVGLARQLPGGTATLAGLALTLLPALGLSVPFRSGAIGFGAGAWIWSLAVLLCLPLYFPGERSEATASGLRFLAAPLGAAGAEHVAGLGRWTVALLGPEPERLPVATPLSRTEPSQGAGGEDGGSLARLEAASRAEPGPDQGVTILPFEGDGASLRVSAFFDGPVYGEEFGMIFDTGATYTTLNRQALARLDVEVPPDAPTAILHTATGEAEAPLVLLDAVWLGDEMVAWVTVAVCEPCAADGVAGLLGLNVTKQFEVALRHDRKQIELRRLRGRDDRRLDISQWLALESRLRRWRDGRVELALQGRNRSRAEIARVLAEVDCPGGRFGVELGVIPAHSSTTTRMSLPRNTDCGDYRIELLGGSWSLEEF